MDKDKLLAWLREKAETRSLLPAAIYFGLSDRIERGDFDATCVCNIGVQVCPDHPDRPILRGDDKEGQLAFRKDFDERVARGKAAESS